MSGKPRLEYAFAVTVAGRIAFEDGVAHIYTTLELAQDGQYEVINIAPEHLKKEVRIQDIHIDSLNQFLS